MAGDWIKVEHVTPNKPEISTIAEYLGVSRREAVGLVVDYFIWLDQNLDDSRNGLVTLVSRTSVEQTLSCPGFAALLERVGWAKFDDEARTMTVINWQSHNGNTAKSRALGQQRAKRFRNASVTQDALPEKRREEKSITPTSSVLSEPQTTASAPAEPRAKANGEKRHQQRATRLPADWFLPDEWRDWAVGAYHLDPQHAVRISLGFRDWFLQKPGADGTSLDWRRRWQVWVRREMERNHA